MASAMPNCMWHEDAWSNTSYIRGLGLCGMMMLGWDWHLGSGGDVLSVHESHGVTEEEDIWRGQPGYNGFESGDLNGSE